MEALCERNAENLGEVGGLADLKDEIADMKADMEDVYKLLVETRKELSDVRRFVKKQELLIECLMRRQSAVPEPTPLPEWMSEGSVKGSRM